VLMSWDESDPEIKTFFSSFMQGLAKSGWTDGGNVQMEVRWAGGNIDRLRMFAKELVDLQPDVILATSTPATAALQQATRAIPIVFAGISDPVGAGFVASLSRPGGNLTGFINMEGAFGGKWLEVLKEIAPDQASRNHVQSRHGSRWRIILSAVIRCRSSKAQSRADRSACS
jgi:putative tryptophan/tyrosine transport system substrate-binding protein